MLKSKIRPRYLLINQTPPTVIDNEEGKAMTKGSQFGKQLKTHRSDTQTRERFIANAPNSSMKHLISYVIRRS